MLERVTVTSYVTPLREGGSLPGLVEADNLGTYVLKFRGAGHGTLALVAEIIGGQLARRLGLRTPELALAWLDPRIAASEPDQEIQDLLRASEGLNLAIDFLPGSAGFDPPRPSRSTRASTCSAAAPPGWPKRTASSFRWSPRPSSPR